MADEELAKEYAKPWKASLAYVSVKEAYLTGLKAGRLTKWHKVADGDLPEEGVEVLNDDGVAVILLKGHWRYVYGGEWEDDACLDHWCEIPKFEEADK